MNINEHDIDNILDIITRRRVDNFEENESGKMKHKDDFEFSPNSREDTIAINEDISLSPINEEKNSMFEKRIEEILEFRLFQFWPGNNSFCLEGKMLNGQQKPSNQKRISVILVMLIFLVYLLFPASHLYEKISPYLTLVTIYMFILTVFFYFLTYA